MRKTGRIGLLLLAALLTAGCRRQESVPETETEKETLSFLTVAEDVQVASLVEKFNEENDYGAELVMECYGTEEYKDVLARKAATGEAPDLFFSWSSGFLQNYVEKGTAAPLEDRIDWLNRFDERTLQDVTVDGSVYAVPNTIAIAVVYYDKQIFETHGLTIPETFAEFLELCETLKGLGYCPISLDSDPWKAGMLFQEILLGICGEEIIQSTEPDEIDWQSEDTEQAAALLSYLGEKEYVPQDFTESERKQETWGMMIGGSWSTAMEPSDEALGVFLLPGLQNSGIVAGGVDRCYAMSSSCTNTEAAVAFLELLSGDRFQEELYQEGGQLPAVRTVIEESGTGRQKEYLSFLQEAEQTCQYMDVKFGEEFGEEFNRAAQKLLLGADVDETLEQLQEAAEKTGG